MKNIYKFMLIVSIPFLMAHSVWIQIENKGRVGKEAKVNLYFGEIRNDLIEKGLKYYDLDGDRFKEYKAFVKVHDAEDMEMLDLAATEESVYANFTPNRAGIYQLVAFNEAGAVKDYTKHGWGLLKDSTYLRTTFEATDRRAKQKGKIDLQPMMTYDIIPFPAKNGYGDYESHQSTWRVGEKVFATFYINGVAASDKKITVYSPHGWTSVEKSDENGMFNFTPYTKGTYQAIYETRNDVNGEYKGAKYNTTRVKVITNLNVK